MGRKMGIEFEYSGGALRVLNGLNERGLADVTYFHPYHHRCSECQYDRTDVSFFAQQDCTADGEVIMHVHEHDSDRFHNAISGLAAVVHDVKPDISEGVGMHTHVSHEGFTPKSFRRLWRLYVRYQDDLADLASGSFGRVRSYNRPLDVSYSSNELHDLYENDTLSAYGLQTSWLVKKQNTMEFRLWNATRNEWRIRLAAGISVAIMNAVDSRQNGGGAVEVERYDTRPLIEVIGDFANDDAYAGLLRQFKWKDC